MDNGMERTRIKVCGITRSADARRAVAVGVDALGFIFAEQSRRKIDPDKAREIISAMPPFVDAVGVFVNAELSLVNEIARYCGLTMVQLHGKETPEYCGAAPVRVIKSFAVHNGTERCEFEPYAPVATGFLLDTWHEKLEGGTGKTFDWSLVESFALARPLILAGGLNPGNVGEAVRRLRPFAVDVNSGVESEPGVKDHDLIAALVREVRRVDADLNGGAGETA
jgi:phosphoribosylanthranilate isomerase